MEGLLSLLQECPQIKNLTSLRCLHYRAVSRGLNSIPILGDHLIRMFSACYSLFEANLTFSQVNHPSVYTWHAIISTHIMLHQYAIAFHLYGQMQQEGITPGRVTLLCILRASGNMQNLKQGMLVHHHIMMNGRLWQDAAIASSLIDMYARSRALNEAQSILTKCPNSNLVSYNAIMTICAQIGESSMVLEFFSKILYAGISPNNVTYSAVLKACAFNGAISQIRVIQAITVEDGVYTDIIVDVSLVDAYAKCGILDEATQIFQKSKIFNVVSWNTLIAGYVHNYKGLDALALYQEMQEMDVRPDSITFSIVVKASGMTYNLGLGRVLHDQILQCGLEQELGVANMLVDMYGKCGSLDDCLLVFDRLSHKDIIAWGSVIAGYVQHGHVSLAMKAFEDMQKNGFLPSKPLVLSLLKACGNAGNVIVGKALHKRFIGLDTIIGSAVIDMYVKCGYLNDAQAVFGEMNSTDVVLWNSLITGYIQNGENFCAIELFEKMHFQGLQPDNTTFSSVVKACGSAGSIEQGKLLHHEVVSQNLQSDAAIGNSLIDMYATCGALEDAKNIFSSLPCYDVGSWGAMLSGYARNGEHELAKKCFKEMKDQKIGLDEKAFTSILSSCSHAGVIEEAYIYLKSMKIEHGISPSNEHFNCMIDLLASNGKLKETVKLIEEMPFPPDTTGWMSLLAACRRYGDVPCGRWCFDQIFRVDSRIAAAYVIASNIFADANLHDDVCKIIKLKQKEFAWKKPGIALVEVDRKTHEFVVGTTKDNSINQKINRLKRLCMTNEALFPQLDLVVES